MPTSGDHDHSEPAGPWQSRRHSCPASFDDFLEEFPDDFSSPVSSPFRPGTPACSYGEHQDDTSDASYRSAGDEFDCSHHSEDGYDTDPFEGFSSVGLTINQMLEDIASSQALLDDYETVGSTTLYEDSIPAASTLDEMINGFSHPAMWHNGNIDFTYLDPPMPGDDADVESALSEESSDIFVDALTDTNDDPFTGDTFADYNYLPSTSSPHTLPLLPNHYNHHLNNNTSQDTTYIDPDDYNDDDTDDFGITLSSVAHDVDGLLDFAATTEARLTDLSDTLRLQRGETRACVDELGARLQGVADDTHDRLVEARDEVLRLAARVAEVEDLYRRLAGCRERGHRRFKAGSALQAGGEEPGRLKLDGGAEERKQQHQQHGTHRDRCASSTSSLTSVDGEVLDMFRGSILTTIPEETNTRALDCHARHRRRTSGDITKTIPSEPDAKREEEHEHPQGSNSWGYVGVMLEAYIYAGFVLVGASLVAS